MFYAVHKGNTVGVFNSWDEAKIHVLKYTGAVYRKFKKREDAEVFVRTGEYKKKGKSVKKGVNVEISQNSKKDSVPQETNSICPVPLSNFVISQKRPTTTLVVFTDGATSNNQTAETAKGGCGVYYGFSTGDNLSIPFTDRPTNNRCELYAILLAIQSNIGYIYEKESNILEIHSDSLYCIQMIDKIRVKPPSLSMANYNLLYLIYNLIKRIHSQVIIKHVRAHTNLNDIYSMGNKRADELAVNGTKY